MHDSAKNRNIYKQVTPSVRSKMDNREFPLACYDLAGGFFKEMRKKNCQGETRRVLPSLYMVFLRLANLRPHVIPQIEIRDRP